MKDTFVRLLEPAFAWLTRYMAHAGLIQFAYGFGGFIGFARETNWGSGVAATDYVEGMSEDLTLSLDRFAYKAIINSLSEPDDAVGLYRVEGGMEFACHPVAIGHFLKGVLHSYNPTAVVTGSLYNHVFVTTSGGADFDSQVPIQPYTIEVFRDVTSSHRYTGCVVNELTFTMAANGPVMCSATFIGRGADIIAKSTPTFPTSPLKPFTFDTISLAIAGSGTALIETLELTINNNLEGIGALNLSRYVAKVRRNDHQMVNLSGTIDFTNVTEYQNFVNQTEQRMTISMTKAASFQMVIDIPRMVYTAYPMGIPGKERILTSFEGKGFVHQGSLNAIKVTLTNQQSYYGPTP